MTKPFCPHCNAYVSDEECPHWDFEHDPREHSPVLSGEGFSAFWKTCPHLPWFKAMQKFHARKKGASRG